MAASTSTAVDSNNNSCFDVFISHRGPDVKKTFASHMYRRLISYGLRVFLDYQELQEGEDLTCQIKGAIRTASVQIAIFSPTYADSQWCLDELVLMLETRASIIPVFYHVKPNALRRTQGEGVYATSLRNLEKKRKYDSEPRYDSKTIENWRNALSRAADISGFDLDEGFHGDEGELLDRLVEVVLKKGKKKLNVAKYPTGLDEKVEEFETKLSLHQHNETVQFVGITGLGGAGKTTLAKELFNRKSSRYSKSCFLIDVREKAKISIPSLQRKLLKDLNASEEPIDSKDEGIEFLSKHFSVLSAPVLLVLDDVDHQDQVYALLPVTDKGMLPLPPGSLILITARDKNVLTRSGVQEPSIYKLTALNRERSRQLFCSHAFGQPHPMPGFEHLVNQFLKACNGLPLSLKVFGGLLCGNTNKSYWKEELEELRKALPHEIQKCLQISYDALQAEEKQIFLDIACFFIGIDRDTAIRVWDASGWNGSRVFESLLNKCLVELDIIAENSDDVYDPADMYERPMKYRIRMHDHLRDMGRNLANTSGFQCRLWRGTKHIDDLLQESSEATKVRGIRMLRWEHYDQRASVSRYKMKNLQLLDIVMKEDDLKCLLEGVDSTNLLWFRWRYCTCSSLPPYIPMEKLRVLDVEGNLLESLWREDLQAPLQLRELRIHASLSKIPKSIGQLKHLERIVVISRSQSIVEIPLEFCDLRSLKQLVLRITNLSSLPDSFGNLSRLEYIDLSGCKTLERLPDSFGNLSRLEYFDLSGCKTLERLPHSFGNLSGLEYIDLSDCLGLERLPDSFGNLMTLEYIDLSDCHGLERLPDSFGNLLRLEHIDLYYRCKLKRLPDSFGNLSRLQYINLSRCGLESLPDSFGNLLRLQHISLSWCGLESLPDSFGNLSRLQRINLSECLDLKRLPDSLGNLSSLEHINLYRCRSLERLPDSFGNLSRLEHINRSCCSRLERLPDSFGDLSKLEHIYMYCCAALERLADSFGDLSSLKRMDLSFCDALERLPVSFGDLSSLQHIELSNCSALERLPDSFGNLSRLEHIDLSERYALRRLPDSFGNLIKLEYLNLGDCNLLTIPGGTFGKITLEYMALRECHIEVLPLQIAHQWSREELLLYLLNLKEWPSATGESSLLEKLVLETPFLEALPPSLGRDLRNLKYLELRRCRSLKRLPDSFLLLDQLIKLIVEDCSLQELHFEAVEGRSETLTDLGGQGTFSNLEGRLLRLQHLELNKTQISDIYFLTGVCPDLQHLEIKDCQDLVEVGTLPNALIKLQLIDCPKLRKIQRLCGFAKLQMLDVSRCKEVEELPSIEGKSETLTGSRGHRALSIWDSSFDKCLLSLQHIELHKIQISEISFPTDVCPNLQHLDIRQCEDLIEVRTLPNALIKLQVNRCPKLKLMSIADLAQVMQLREIRINFCCQLEELLGVGYLKSLEVMQVSGCRKLKSIRGLEQLTQLRELDVSCCFELEELLGVGQLKSLEVLKATMCENLTSIRSLEQLTQLRELHVSYCDELEELLGVGHLKSLQVLKASGCAKLKRIQGLDQLTQLRKLDVSKCYELKELPRLNI